MAREERSGAGGCWIAALLVIAALGGLIYYLGFRPIQIGVGRVETRTPNSPTVAPASNGTITVQTSETYTDRLAPILQRWNRERPTGPTARLLPKEGSRKAMQRILQGKLSPDVWLSSTEELVTDLANASGGSARLNLDDSDRKVVLPSQPLVFLVRGKPGSPLDALLRQPNPLPDLPADKYRYSCADVLKSGGGDSAARYLKWSFRQSAGRFRSFQAYLEDLKRRGFVLRLKDSGPLAADFISDTELSFVIVHNPLADREIAKYPGRLHKVIPGTTLFERPTAVVLESGWNRNGEESVKFLRFLRDNFTLNESEDAASIGDVGDVQNEKRIWETVFNRGRRL